MGFLFQLYDSYFTRAHGFPSWLSTSKIYRRLPPEVRTMSLGELWCVPSTYMLLSRSSPGFYFTFWQLSMYDLAPPASRYAEEGATLRTLSRQEDSKYIAADRSSDRARRATATLHRQRRDRFNSYANLLAEELKEQSASRQFTITRLAREKLHWFLPGK